MLHNLTNQRVGNTWPRAVHVAYTHATLRSRDTRVREVDEENKLALRFDHECVK